MVDITELSIEVLTRWVMTERDIESIFDEVAAQYGVADEEYGRVKAAVLSDYQHLQRANLARLRGLRGNSERLGQEIAGILRW